MSKTIGVLGGMGPQATVDFFQKVVSLTKASCDQEHLHLIIDNNTKTPDRSSFILGHGDDPVRELITGALKLQLMGADLLVMPCNTAHFFYEQVNSVVNIPFINMIEEVTANILLKYGKGASIGLLATNGTYCGGMYERAFEKNGLNLILPDETSKQYIFEYIYNIKQGTLEVGFEKVTHEIKRMEKAGVSGIILGCTELPLITNMLPKGPDYIDTTGILAQRAVEYALAI